MSSSPLDPPSDVDSRGPSDLYMSRSSVFRDPVPYPSRPSAFCEPESYASRSSAFRERESYTSRSSAFHDPEPFSFSDDLSFSGTNGGVDRHFLSPGGAPMSRGQESPTMFSASSTRSGPHYSSRFPSSQYDPGLKTESDHLRAEITRLRGELKEIPRLRKELNFALGQAETWKTAFNQISGNSGQKFNDVTSELKDISESVANTHGNSISHPSGPPTSSSASLFAFLDKAKPLPPLDPANFWNIVHWHPTKYRKLRRTPKSQGTTVPDELEDLESGSLDADEPKKKKGSTLSCYLEDQNGSPISETEKKAILSMAHAFWQYLLDNGKAPKKFSRADLPTKLQWRALMETNFECLRYCDSHWKVDQVWTNHYPSWLKTVLGEKAKANGESDDSVIDVDAEPGSNEDKEATAEDQDIEAVRYSKGKRGPPDSNETSSSKRPRAEGPETSAPRPRPVPKKITTNRARIDPLAHVRATPTIPETPTPESAPATAGDNASPPTPVSSLSETSSNSLESPAPRSITDTSGSDSADNLDTQTALPPSLSPSAPQPALSRDSRNTPPAATNTQAAIPDVSISRDPLPSTSVTSAAISASDSATRPPSSDLTPAVTSSATSAPQNTLNMGFASQMAAATQSSRKTAMKKAPKPKRIAPSKQLCFNEWKEKNPDVPEEDFEGYWKELPRSVKTKFTARAKKLEASSGQGTSN